MFPITHNEDPPPPVFIVVKVCHFVPQSQENGNKADDDTVPNLPQGKRLVGKLTPER